MPHRRGGFLFYRFVGTVAQEATITQLKKETETVAAHVKEQDSKIQRVSDQLELSKPAPQMVSNDQR